MCRRKWRPWRPPIAPVRARDPSSFLPPNCHRPSRVTAWSCARRRARRCASLRPRVSRGLRALTAAARSSRNRQLRDGRSHCRNDRLSLMLTRGSARRILPLSRRCLTTPPPLRTQCRRSTFPIVALRARSDVLSPTTCCRCSTDGSDIRSAHRPWTATRRLRDPRCLTAQSLRRSRHTSRTRRRFLTIGWSQVIDHDHRRREQSSCGPMSAECPHLRH